MHANGSSCSAFLPVVRGGQADQQSLSLAQSAGCGPNPLLVTNISDTQNAAWLAVLNKSSPYLFQANPAALMPGTYSDTIVITAPAASNSPLSVPVTFTVTNFQPLPDAVLEEPYSVSIGNYSCSLASGAPPPGLTVTVVSGVCTASGMATALGSYQFTISYIGGQTGYQITVDSSASAFQVTPSVSATSADTSTAPVSQTINVTNTGDSTASFNASIVGPAIAGYSITPASGSLAPSGSTQLTVTFNSGGAVVPPGFYTGTYTITNTTSAGSGQVARHRFQWDDASLGTKPDLMRPRVSNNGTSSNSGTSQNTVTAQLEPSISELQFTLSPGSQQMQQIIISDASNATNVSVSAVYGGAGAVAGGLQPCSPSGGNEPVAIGNPCGTTPITMTATATTAGLAPGGNQGAITIDCVNVICETPLNIPVIISVASPPVIAVTPPSLRFDYTIGGAVPAAQSLQITNGGGGTLSWSATANASWLSVTPASSTAPSTLSVLVSPASLVAGTYTAVFRSRRRERPITPSRLRLH